MKYLLLLLFAFGAHSATAQEGQVYRCMKDGTRYYKSKPMEGANCETVTYSADVPAIAWNGWIPLGRGDDISSYYRTKGLTRKGNKVSLWILDDFAKKQTLPNTGYYLSTIGRWSIDCDERTYQPLQLTFYSQLFGTGESIGQMTTPHTKSSPYATPGSLGEIMVDTACRITEPKANVKKKKPLAASRS